MVHVGAHTLSDSLRGLHIRRELPSWSALASDDKLAERMAFEPRLYRPKAASNLNFSRR